MIQIPTADDLEPLTARLAAVESRVAALEQPRVVPPSPPVPSARRLLGGYRVAEGFAKGVFAVDWGTRELYMRGFDPARGGRFVLVLDLNTPMGTGLISTDWPVLPLKRTIDTPWWPMDTDGDCYGLAWFGGKLWCCPRRWYDTNPRSDVAIYALDGESRVIDFPGGGDAQRFDGFVKGPPGTDPLLGGGAYDSGQGSVSGATAGTMSGEVKLVYGWPGLPGPNLEHWNERAPRPANYDVAADSWVGWKPRLVNGVLEGRWASDSIHGGGLILPEGVCYWARLGTGLLDYAHQSLCFAPDDAHRETWEYRYDPGTWEFKGYHHRPDLGYVLGQDQDDAGRVWLMEADGWRGTTAHKADPVLKVFG